jgi:FAD/FMN-containing dehydrogenase
MLPSPGAPDAATDPATATLRRSLADELRRRLEGEVRFDALAQALYATDASPYRIAPHGVVFPRHRADLARRSRWPAPTASRCCCAAAAPAWPARRWGGDRRRHLAPPRPGPGGRRRGRTARVEPGAGPRPAQRPARAPGLQFTPDVSTSDRATIGGMVANDSAGTRSLKYGKTIDQVIAMTVLLADGTVAELRALDAAELAAKLAAPGVEGDAYRTVHRIVHEHEAEIRARTPKVMRRVGGYPLDALLPGRAFNLAKLVCGSEGTLAAILDVTLALHPVPRRRVLALLHFATWWPPSRRCRRSWPTARAPSS